MLIRAYQPSVITALFAGLFIATGILTFGNALIFDRLFIAILIFTALVCTSNINVVGSIAILALERLLEELFWFLLHDLWNNIWYLKIIVYCLLCWTIYDLYPFAMQSIATFTLWIVFNENHKLIKSRFIHA